MLRRVLALAGFAALAVQIAAAFLPPAVFLPLAAVLCLAALLVWKRKASFARGALLVLCVAAACLLWRTAYLELRVRPIQQRAGTTAAVEATVLATRPGYANGLIYATVRVESMEGERLAAPFSISVDQMPLLEPGERFRTVMTFVPLPADAYRLSNYADGVYLGAAALQGRELELLGPSPGLLPGLLRLQGRLANALRRQLGEPLGSLAAAMTVGSRDGLQAEIKENFRRAGLSHVLVVSGLHLSAVSGLVYAGLRKLLKRRRAAALGACAATAAFMLLVGATPSVIRAGVVMLLVYGAMLARRKSDALTSLGAALLLLLVNPFAALDAGLLLSFSATLGVLCAHTLWRQTWGAAERGTASRWKRWSLKVLQATAISAGATLGTLPVLILLRSGISLLTLACNLLVVPVLPLTICFGFCAAVAASVPLLSVLAGPAGLLCGLCLRWIAAVAQLAAAVPGAFVHITGEYAFGACLLLYGLLFGAWKWRVPLRRTLAGCAAFLLCAVVLYGAVQGNAVTAVPCGSAENAPVLLLQRGRTVVLYRGPETAAMAVQEELELHDRTQIDLLIDLRADGDAAALAEQLPAQETFTVARDCINRATFQPFYDTIITVKRQAEGSFACVETGGCKLGVSSGAVDVSPYPPFDVYFGGSSAVEGLRCNTLILSRTGRAWTQTAEAKACLTGSVRQVQLSPRGVWTVKEEWYGTTG